MMKPVQFGGVQILTQKAAFQPMFEYNNAVEAIRRRIRGNLEVMGYDREVDMAVKAELGEGPKYQDLQAVAEQQKTAFVAQKAADNAENPDYRAILFLMGNLNDPINANEKSHQTLLIDGPDVARFSNAVFNMAYFTQNVRTPEGRYVPGVRQVANVTDFYAGKLENEFRRVKEDFYKEAVSAYQAGDATRILSLDA